MPMPRKARREAKAQSASRWTGRKITTGNRNSSSACHGRKLRAQTSKRATRASRAKAPMAAPKERTSKSSRRKIAASGNSRMAFTKRRKRARRMKPRGGRVGAREVTPLTWGGKLPPARRAVQDRAAFGFQPRCRHRRPAPFPGRLRSDVPNQTEDENDARRLVFQERPRWRSDDLWHAAHAGAGARRGSRAAPDVRGQSIRREVALVAPALGAADHPA